MSDISKIDSNFSVKEIFKKDDIKLFNVDEKPFKIYGVFREDGIYRRMPQKVAESVNNGVNSLNVCTAGGRVRFVTDSPYIAIHAELNNVIKSSHFAFTGTIGLDMYADNKYVKTFIPPTDVENTFDGILPSFGDTKEREITINFPLYSGVSNLYVGLKEGSTLKEASPYKNSKPIVYYGSSITQGGCASRPGMSYEAIVSRNFDYDYINLGFSGSAKAEDTMAEYISNLDMSLFVYDYDHNATSIEELEPTHERMFKAIRKKNPLLPVIIMPRPKHLLNDAETQRYDIIKRTYNNAVSAGDKNVWFIDNKALTKLCKDSGTVDGVHPTDFGFAAMAEAVSEVISKIDI